MTRPPQTPPPRTAWTVPEVAQSIGVSAKHLYRQINAGEFPGTRVGGRVVVFCADFDAWVKAQRHTA